MFVWFFKRCKNCIKSVRKVFFRFVWDRLWWKLLLWWKVIQCDGVPNWSKSIYWGKSETLLGGIFLSGGKNLRRSDFGNTNFFQSEKSILWVLNINSNQNYIVWPVCHEIKTKMVQEQRLQLKITCLLGHNLT